MTRTVATLDVSSPAVAFREAVAAVPDADLLKFHSGNGKLDSVIDHFSIPAGWSCPGARLCLARAVKRGTNEKGRDTYGVEDGPEVEFRCFSASEEARYPQVRKNRWHNFDMLRKHGRGTPAEKVKGMASLILASLPYRPRVFDLSVDGRAYKAIVRGHIGGDFFSQEYFDAWATVCRLRPDILFYAYTKSLPFWVARLGLLPDNFVLTASEGGKWDSLIGEHGLRSARVFLSQDEADAAGLEVDHDDSHAMRRGPSFALLVHGTQPPGSLAAKAWAVMQRNGGGHGKTSRARSKAGRKGRVSLPVLAN